MPRTNPKRAASSAAAAAPASDDGAAAAVETKTRVKRKASRSPRKTKAKAEPDTKSGTDVSAADAEAHAEAEAETASKTAKSKSKSPARKRAKKEVTTKADADVDADADADTATAKPKRGRPKRAAGTKAAVKAAAAAADDDADADADGDTKTAPKSKAKPKAAAKAKAKPKKKKSGGDATATDASEGPDSKVVRVSDSDGKARCWGRDGGPMQLYHDAMWGRPARTNELLLKIMTLELMQCGLSWTSICNKMESFTRAFDDWDVERVAAYKQKDIDRLLADTGIVRNKLKINAVITNAKQILEIDRTEEGGFVKWIWQFAPNNDDERLVAVHRQLNSHMRSDFATKSSDRVESDGVHATVSVGKLAKALKTKGFKFMGETVVLSLMQAAGFVNHHKPGCFAFKEIEDARAEEADADADADADDADA